METKALINAAMMLAVYLVLLLLFTMGIFTTLLAIALPVPIIVFSVISKKYPEVLLLFIGCVIGSYLVASFPGLMATGLYGLSGAVLGISIIGNRPYWQRLLNASVVHLVGVPLFSLWVTGISMADLLRESVGESIQLVENLSPTTDLTHFSQAFDQILSDMLPAILLISGFITVFLTDKLAVFIMKRLRLEVPSMKKWESFQLGIVLAVTFLIGQLASHLDFSPVLRVVVFNLVLVLNLLFAVQGLVVIAAIFKSRGKARIGFIIGVLMFITGFVSVLSMVGVMDTLFNYRKRFALRSGV